MAGWTNPCGIGMYGRMGSAAVAVQSHGTGRRKTERKYDRNIRKTVNELNELALAHEEEELVALAGAAFYYDWR